MKTIRTLHYYLGVFFAPSIIFFAFSGALQTFSLHEGDHPQKWIETMGEVHKNQRPPAWMKPAAQQQNPAANPPRPPEAAAGEGRPTQAQPATQQQSGAQSAAPATGATINAGTASASVSSQTSPNQASAPQAGSSATSPPQSTSSQTPAKAAAPVRRGPPRQPKSVPFKIFAALMSTGLIFSSILGILIAFRMKPDPKPIWGMLAAGVIVPMLMLYFN
jgi:hypothetical protein